MLAPLLLQAPASAEEEEKKSANDFGTEQIFGFTEGADIGEKGEKEIENTTTARFGKRSGSYGAADNELAFLYNPTDSYRLSISGLVDHHQIRNVPDLADRNALNFNGLSGELRARLMERNDAPFGLAVSVSPQWSRIDQVSGARVDRYGLTTILLADAELVPRKLFFATNIAYTPSTGFVEAFDREPGSRGAWQPESSLDISAAIAGAVRPDVLIGAEARYLTTFEGVFLNRLQGQAFFLGPSLYVQLSKHFAFKATWSAQVAGKAVDDPAARLDLVNFERHQVRALLVHNF